MQSLKSLWVRLIRFGFRLLYNELAWTYDLVSWVFSLGEWRRWQRAGLQFLNGRKLLEIGHGPGHLLLQMAQDGKLVVGLDLSPYMGRQARRRLRKNGQTADLTQAMVQGLPFVSQSFESVLSTFPTDYVVDPDTLAEVHRVLVENGRFVIVPEGHLTTGGLLQTVIDWLFRITGQRSEAFEVNEEGFWPSQTIWQPLRERLETAGFQVRIEQVSFKRSAATVIVATKS
ncbi:MAG: methyltransferase domain-containing protein [Chloroflexota bacterium]